MFASYTEMSATCPAIISGNAKCAWVFYYYYYFLRGRYDVNLTEPSKREKNKEPILRKDTRKKIKTRSGDGGLSDG